MRAHVLAEAQTAVFDGTGWDVPGQGPLAPSQLGVNTTADAVNRLAVSSDASLFNHDGGEQLLLAAKVLIKRGFRHPGQGRDGIHRGARIALVGKDLQRRVKDPALFGHAVAGTGRKRGHGSRRARNGISAAL